MVLTYYFVDTKSFSASNSPSEVSIPEETVHSDRTLPRDETRARLEFLVIDLLAGVLASRICCTPWTESIPGWDSRLTRVDLVGIVDCEIVCLVFWSTWSTSVSVRFSGSLLVSVLACPYPKEAAPIPFRSVDLPFPRRNFTVLARKRFLQVIGRVHATMAVLVRFGLTVQEGGQTVWSVFGFCQIWWLVQILFWKRFNLYQLPEKITLYLP